MTNVHGCDANSEEEKEGLGFSYGRSWQMRVTIFETTCCPGPFSPSSYVFFFIYFPQRKAYLLSRMHPIPFPRTMYGHRLSSSEAFSLADRGGPFLRLRTVDLLIPRSPQFVIKFSHRSL